MRTIKTFTPVAAGPEMRYQSSGDQNPSIFNFNQSPTVQSKNSQSVMLTTPQYAQFKQGKGGYHSSTNAP